MCETVGGTGCVVMEMRRQWEVRRRYLFPNI